MSKPKDDKADEEIEMEMDDGDVVAKAGTSQDATRPHAETDKVLEKCPDRIVETLATALKDEPVKLAGLLVEYHNKLNSKASGFKSRDDAGRSRTIDLFAGKPEQLGKEARDWLHTVEVYLDSVDCKRPVPKIATYLRGDAQTWWNTVGKAAVGLNATFAQFSVAFLARFVKAADGRKAGEESSAMK